MPYAPRPIGLTGPPLSSDLETLTETLAENVHELWAIDRMAAGWTAGPHRDDEAKTDPSLVPYCELPESKKHLDRLTALGTLKTLLGLGFSIARTGTPSADAAAPILLPFPSDTADRPDYDMDDAPERLLLSSAPKLAAALEHLSTLRPLYLDADRKALGLQRRRHRLVAVTSGTAVATALAAVGLTVLWAHGSTEELTRLLGDLGMTATVAVAGTALLAVVLAFQRNWLLERHRATSYRTLKFRLLADPRLWSGATAEWRASMEEGVAQIRLLDQGHLRERTRTDVRAGPPADLERCPLVDIERQRLVDYYQSKRIAYQIDYFARRALTLGALDRSLRWPTLFFAGVAVMLVAYLVNRFTMGQLLPPLVYFGLIASAALLPALAVGFRTYRQAHELARSAALYAAKADSMRDFAKRLNVARSDSAAVLRTIWECETFLDSEHREWLRLMLEAEIS